MLFSSVLRGPRSLSNRSRSRGNRRPKRSGQRARRPAFEPLEERTLLAMTVGTDLDEPTAGAIVAPNDARFGSWGGEIAFVDSNVPGYQELVAGMTGAEVRILDSERDGVEQISEDLAHRQGVEAVHIVSHGAAGALQLGTGRLNLQSLDGLSEKLRCWGASLAEDADILDVGGESSRPGSDPVSIREELDRVIPVIREVKKRHKDIVISIDTYKAEIARAALDEGADIINDISAATFDSEMMKIAVESGAGIVLMHMKGTPKTMQDAPHYDDILAAYLFYDVGTDLLIPPAKNAALTADKRDDDLGPAPF